MTSIIQITLGVFLGHHLIQADLNVLMGVVIAAMFIWVLVYG